MPWKWIALGFVILFAASAPQIIGQEKEPLHYSAGTGRANLNFVADSEFYLSAQPFSVWGSPVT